MKKILLATLSIAMLVFTSCKKGDTGPIGETGPAGPEAKTYTVDLTYTSGSTYQNFSGVTGFDAGDVLLFYMAYEDLGEMYYAPLPLTLNGIDYIPEFSENSGNVFINTYNEGTTSSPWSSNITLRFKIVHLKGTGLIKHPNVDFNDYEAVKKEFNL